MSNRNDEMNRRPTRNNPANNKQFISGGVMTNLTASAPIGPELPAQAPASVAAPNPIKTPVSVDNEKSPLKF